MAAVTGNGSFALQLTVIRQCVAGLDVFVRRCFIPYTGIIHDEVSGGGMDRKSRYALGQDVNRAIIEAKNALQVKLAGRPVPPKFKPITYHEGLELLRKINLGLGAQLFEYDVGHDRVGGRGRRRLVLAVLGSGQVRVYFTGEHYQIDSWYEVFDA